MPDFEDGDLSRPVWRLEAELDDEGYTPPYGTFHELFPQIARFRDTTASANSMRVAVAGTLAGTDMADAASVEPHLVFSDAPGSVPIHLTSAFEDQRTTFLTSAPPERVVLSFEVLGEGRFGRHRQMLEPLPTERPGLSDLLLYRPEGDDPPETLEAATELMLGALAVEEGQDLGIFWETYGAGEGASVQIELEVEGQGGGGPFGWIGRLFGGDDAPARLSWTEPSSGPVAPRGVALGLAGLEPGRYTLVLRTTWEGQEPLEARRSFEVRPPDG